MIIDGYIRVSHVGARAGDSFISPDLQRERIERWCALSGATLSAVHVELDQSGGNPDRPLLQQALRRIESGDTGGLVVARMDRFGRSLVHALQAIERIDKAGGAFVSVDDGLDLTTNTGWLVLRIMLSLAEFELDRIRDTWVEADRRAIDRGVFIGSIPPTGYRITAGRRLVLDPRVAPFIKQAFERRGEGEGIWSICRWLEANQVKTSLGNTGWHSATLARMLRNRVYLGEGHRGDYRKPGAHPALVDSATWHRAQSPRQSQPSRRDELLAGLLRCASCRMKLHAGLYAGRVYYCCGVQHARGKCPAPATLRATVSEQLIAEALRKRLAKPPAAAPAKLVRAEGRLTAAEAAVVRYRDNASLETTLGRDRFNAGLQKRVTAEARLAMEVARLRSEHMPTTPVDWDGLDQGQRKALLRAHLDCVFVAHSRLPAKERMFICWRGEAPTALPRPGAAHTPLRAFDPSECFGAAPRRPSPRAFQARWPELKLEAELSQAGFDGDLDDRTPRPERGSVDAPSEEVLRRAARACCPAGL